MDFQTLFDSLKNEVIKLASSSLKSYKKEAQSDALRVAEELKEDLKAWTIQLATGEMAAKDFEFLILAKKELIEMTALKQKGLAKIKIDEFKTGLLNCIISTVTGLI
ncbi:hypothetical protein [Gaoshiqia sp. Z1-71]|uniref:hypothetical protein n=1 Tax=Gaoshiqia hydrogeniformans TaxID=3290090 RepID=UPI003BF8B7E8